MSVRLWAPAHPRGCCIALADGTTLLIPNDEKGIEVPAEFFRGAIFQGCEPVAEREETEPDSLDPATSRGPRKTAVVDTRAPDHLTGSEAPPRGPRADPAATPSQNRGGRAADDPTVDPTLHDRTTGEILRRLRQAGDAGLTRTRISGVFNRNLSAEQIGMALERLRITGRAICESVRTAGRPTELWRAAD